MSHCVDDIESLCVEIINKQEKNALVTALYRPPNGKIKPFKHYIKQLFSNNAKTNKSIYLAGDLNLNVLDYENNTKVKNFFNMIFQHGLIPVINKPTCVTKKSASAIDHIITNSFLTNEIKTGIIKTDVSDHFPIFLICDKFNFDGCPVNNFIFKRYINDTSLQHFENSLNSINWYKIQKINCPNEAYDEFLKTFSSCYEVSFPKVKIKIKSKSFLSPWITKGLIKII